MATAENISIARRVAEVEAQASGLQLLHVRTTIVVLGRQEEPEYLTVAEVLAAADRDPEPVELRREVDLDVLIDPVHRTRKVRHLLSPAGRERFDAIASRARLIEVPITCHEKQLSAIRSTALTAAALGGNQAGKSYALVFWFLRRWLLRGGQGRRFFWVSPNIDKIFAQGLYAIAGQLAQGGGIWPDEVMLLPPKGIPTGSKKLRIDMVDGSVIEFKHGAGDGGNLKSATVVDLVIDELGEVKALGNYKQACVRVSKSGGRVAVATTRVRGHWMEDEIIAKAATSPNSVSLAEFDLFDSPFLTLARIYALFLNDSTLTERQLVDVVLPAEDKRAACLSVIRDPRSLREHFGIETQGSRLMWSNWRDDYTYRSRDHKHATIFVHRDGVAVELRNITAHVLAGLWPAATRKGKRFDRWVGCDANVRGHAVALEIFGEGSTAQHAVANVGSWTILAVDEVQVDGTTAQLGEQIQKQVGDVPIYLDPTAAMSGHDSRGSGGSTDAAELRRLGINVQAANGETQDGRTQHMPKNARDHLNQLMADGRFFVHERCAGLLEAMRKDLAKPDGRPDKRSSPNSQSDYRSGFSDSAHYGAWPLLRKIYKARTSDRADES